MHNYIVPIDPLCNVRPGCVLYKRKAIQVRASNSIKWSTPGYRMTWRERDKYQVNNK